MSTHATPQPGSTRCSPPRRANSTHLDSMYSSYGVSSFAGAAAAAAGAAGAGAGVSTLMPLDKQKGERGQQPEAKRPGPTGGA